MESSLPIDPLWSAQYRLALWLLGFTAVVGIGVVIETWKEVSDLACAVFEYLKGAPFDRSTINKHAIGGIIVIVGLCGEAVIEVLLPIVENRIRAAEEAETARLTADNLDMEKVLQPRRVSSFIPANRPDIFRALRKLDDEFAGTRFLIQSVPFFEAEMLTNDLHFLLTGLKWKGVIVEDWGTTGMRPVLIHDGVEIWTWKPEAVPPMDTKASKSRAWLAAEALRNFLELDGITLVSHFDVSSMKEQPFAPFGFNPSEDSVVVFVGMKNINVELSVLRATRQAPANPSPILPK